jgi:hypothetical protein
MSGEHHVQTPADDPRFRFASAEEHRRAQRRPTRGEVVVSMEAARRIAEDLREVDER